MLKSYFVYILLCNDKSYYTGVTNNIERRILEHNNGVDKKSYTYSRKPVQLVFVEQVQNIDDALSREKQLKGWSRRKKEALIKQEYYKLPALSKNNMSY